MIEQGDKIGTSESTPDGAKLGSTSFDRQKIECISAENTSLPSLSTSLQPQSSPTAQDFSSFDGMTNIRVSTNHPTNFINAERSSKVEVQVGVGLTDCDDTLAKGSGEHAHDSYKARFALGLGSLLFSLHQKSPFLQREHLDEYQISGGTRVFPAHVWQSHYEPFTGRPELVVMECMLQRAQLLCDGIHQLRLEEYVDHLKHVHDKHMVSLLENVTLDESVVSISRAIRSKGGKTAICSASGNDFLDPAVVHLLNGQQNVSSTFNAVFGGVAKKLQCGNFTGEGITQCCQRLGVDPRKAIMLGDSISDVAAAIAGVPIIVIRPPQNGITESDEARATAIFQKMQDLQSKVHGTKSFKTTAATVIQVHDFSQLEIKYCPDIPQSTFRIL